MTAPNPAVPPSCWTFFDKIYCITLESRPDRQLEARRQFAAIGLVDLVEFIVVRKNMADQAQGIFHSHMLCLQKSLAAGARHILVFEDDVFFRGFNRQRLEEACRFLRDNARWNAFFLGCITGGSSPTATRAVRRIRYRCLAHAYAVNRPFAERLVREEWRGIPYDTLLSRHHDGLYALHPMCAYQGLSGSDNRTVVLDRLRNLCGGLPFLQKCSEIFQNNKAMIFALHLLIAIIAIALLTLRHRP